MIMLDENSAKHMEETKYEDVNKYPDVVMYVNNAEEDDKPDDAFDQSVQQQYIGMIVKEWIDLRLSECTDLSLRAFVGNKLADEIVTNPNDDDMKFFEGVINWFVEIFKELNC